MGLTTESLRATIGPLQENRQPRYQGPISTSRKSFLEVEKGPWEWGWAIDLFSTTSLESYKHVSCSLEIFSACTVLSQGSIMLTPRQCLGSAGSESCFNKVSSMLKYTFFCIVSLACFDLNTCRRNAEILCHLIISPLKLVMTFECYWGVYARNETIVVVFDWGRGASENRSKAINYSTLFDG